GSKLANYSPEILYFTWLLKVANNHARDTVLKGGIIRYITTGSRYKAINLLLKYINALYILDIKHYKNSTYNINVTFERLTLNGNYITIIRKSIKELLRSKLIGKYTIASTALDIISYIIKLYNNSITVLTPNRRVS
ncbi:hypothetical protein ACRALDRAFT_2111750, partial [Sodiomyces alcalophilus JCM 7366]|uniref:uncharacterized protein n=1 Tax=Sodiomyces alcalophilus JCM 7366 TaxID=591952 RepID=UPI0039B42816